MSLADLSGPASGGHRAIAPDAVREVCLAVNASHRFVYFVPETAQQAARFGIAERGPAYFAFRSAAMGAVPWQVTLATFYNFSPRAVRSMAGTWDAAPPERWQAARFEAVGDAMRRVGVDLTEEEVAEARSLLDPVVAAAEYAGKPLAAANAAVALPGDPLAALWQQITVVREWRGDAHLVVLADHRLGPCDCNVLQTAAGKFPLALARASRKWNDEEWAAATARLGERGWLDADGSVTAEGSAARERVETETDEHCVPLWAPIGDAGARRLAVLLRRVHDAFTAAGTYSSMR
ncbi:SCO6745 family protein [Streptomyces fuscigenes]|uniref:SCO6745 family protein n=1 Tax=Streptomyces fuscigenes TaxID=1528880 RepID=UPI001F338411|nr:hypothetical protein [Streptomyces fuscigenes]MCF3963390.1 hypothetical protein [Streptomyces fuscigenes]